MATTSIPDPNGDRVCYSRWFHREAETVEINGAPMCSECYVTN